MLGLPVCGQDACLAGPVVANRAPGGSHIGRDIGELGLAEPGDLVEMPDAQPVQPALVAVADAADQFQVVGDAAARRGEAARPQPGMVRLARNGRRGGRRVGDHGRSRARLEKNPLRILDSKAHQDWPIVDAAPTVDDFLTAEASDFFAAVTSGLDAAGVKWTRDPRLVRGLDYYRHTAFEFVTEDLGAQSAVLAGGRYDGLMESLGGPHTPAVGWAAGIERLGMLIDSPWQERPEFVLVPMGSDAEIFCGGFIADLRRRGVYCDMAYRGSLKKRLQRADAAKASYAILVGEDELAAGEVTIRSLKSGEQLRRSVAEILKGPIGGRTFTLVSLTHGLDGIANTL